MMARVNAMPSPRRSARPSKRSAVPALIVRRTASGRASIASGTRWTGDTSGVVRVKSHAVGLTALLPLLPLASGLCVYSQDGRIVRKLQEDANLLEQELVAEVTGTPGPDALARLGHGL